MIRWDSFPRSALFAVGAAALWPAWAMVAGPFIGWRHALALYLVAALTLYIAGLGSTGLARRRAIAVGATATAVALAAFAHTTAELAIALAAVLGCVRSALLYRTRPARAVVTELVLLAGGLLFARFVGGSSMLSIATALWAFFLVQSLFFLVAGSRARARDRISVDPFDEAHRRAIALLEPLECGGLPPPWGGRGAGV